VQLAALERELRTYMLMHQAVLDLIGLTQQVCRLFPGFTFSAGSPGFAPGFARHSHYRTFQMA
jgi:hypothetical protein